MVGNGMEQASGYPWEGLGDSVLVTFVSTFLRILADSVLKIREHISVDKELFYRVSSKDSDFKRNCFSLTTFANICIRLHTFVAHILTHLQQANMALQIWIHLPSFSFVKRRHDIIAECAPELAPLLFVARRHTNRIGRSTNRLLCTETEFLDGITNAARTGEFLERTSEHAAVSEDDGNVEARAKFARRTIQARKAHAVALIMCPLVDISPCKIERARRRGVTQRYAH